MARSRRLRAATADSEIDARLEAAARGFSDSPGQPDTDPEREIPKGKDRLKPGDGTPRPPIEVQLTEVELKALADEFAGEIEYQYAGQESFRSDLARYLEVYRPRPRWGTKTYPIESASDITIAMAANHADQVVARLMQSTFNPQPHWVVSELNKKFAEHCKPYERYLDWNRQNAWNQWSMVYDFVQDTVKLGTGVGYNDWQVKSLYRYDDQQKRTVKVGDRIGPYPRWCAREDFLMPNGFSDIQESPFVAHRPWFSWAALERLAHQDLIENLVELEGHSDEEDSVKEARKKNRDQTVSSSSADDRFGLWAPWYVWFRRDLDQDGWPEEYVMLLHTETRTILRLVSNPSPTGTRPYFSSQFIRVGGEFDGIGIPERLEQLQEEESTIHNQRRDRAHLANIVMYVTDAAGGSTISETIRPSSGKVLKVLGGPDKLKPFNPSSNVMMDIQEEDYVRRMGAELVGQSDIDMSRLSSPAGRAAATTIMALMQEGARRFDLNATQIRMALTEQAHQITELWQVYSLPPAEVAGSPEQVLDEEDAVLVRQLLEQPVSLRGLIGIQLNISTAAVNREVEKQSNIQLYQIHNQYMQMVVGQIAPMIMRPDIPQPLKDLMVKGVQDEDKLLSKIYQAHNAFDLESTLLGDTLAEMARMPQPMPMMGLPPGVAGAGGGPPAPGPPAGSKSGNSPLLAMLGGGAGARR